LTKCVLSKSANFELIPENQTAVTVDQEKLSYTGELTLFRSVICTAAGVFAINCTSYRLCVSLGGGDYIGAEATCPAGQNFNPGTLQCDATYVCPPVLQAGFVCVDSTSFTYYSDALEVIVRGVTCPANHFCNSVCRHPCTRYIYNC
jgi:hypothetical protein